jgi:release factor glutamine methyltransferase
MEKKKEIKSDLPGEYKKGSVKFLGCVINLSHRVFIPRPETEFWAEAAIKDLAGRPVLAVLDMFSGSGCVGIAVLKKIKNSTVDFCDADPRAVKQIKKNLKINKIDKKRYRVYRSDMFKELAPDALYGAILANPPYVDYGRIGEVQTTVLDHEPHLALFSEKNGMAAIEKFLAQAKNHLAEGGVAYLEFDAAQTGRIEKVLKKENYSSWRILRDQFGRDRFARIDK